MRKITLLAALALVATPTIAQQDVRKASIVHTPKESPASFIGAERPVKISDVSQLIVVEDKKNKRLCYVIETVGTLISGPYPSSWKDTTMRSSISCVTAE